MQVIYFKSCICFEESCSAPLISDCLEISGWGGQINQIIWNILKIWFEINWIKRFFEFVKNL